MPVPVPVPITLTNKEVQGDLYFNQAVVEFSPGTGGLDSPFIHVNVPSANPSHIILRGCTTENAVAIRQFLDTDKTVKIGITDRHSGQGGDPHDVANVVSLTIQ